LWREIEEEETAFCSSIGKRPELDQPFQCWVFITELMLNKEPLVVGLLGIDDATRPLAALLS
jgi:hypothetical protein